VELSLLDPRRLEAADVERWRDLAAAAVEPNPFYEPDVLLPAVEHLVPGGVALAVVRAGGDWRACMPVRRQARLGRLPGPCLVAWHHPHAYLGTPLGRDVEAVEELVHRLAGDQATGWLGLPMLATEGPVGRAVLAAAEPRGRLVEAEERAALVRRADGGYLEALPSKRRRELARQARGLASACGAPLQLADRAGEAGAVGAFLSLEHSGWKGEAGTSLRAIDGHAAFFGAMCARLAEAGRLQLLELRAGRRLVAMKCNLLAGDGAFCFKIAYDEQLGRFSPGVQLELRNVDVFHETGGLAFSDSCAAAGNAMINRLWPDRRAVGTLVLPSRTMLGTVARGVLPAALRLRDERRRRRAQAA
jgi:CelD/BcsL family acetyltransferase involved in cellulose biosynthesis